MAVIRFADWGCNVVGTWMPSPGTGLMSREEGREFAQLPGSRTVKREQIVGLLQLAALSAGGVFAYRAIRRRRAAKQK